MNRFSSVVGEKIVFIPIESDEEDYSKYHESVKGMLRQFDRHPRAVDITPDRKFASSIMLQEALRGDVEAIFYLHLLDSSYMDIPLVCGPMMYQRLIDFKEELA